MIYPDTADMIFDKGDINTAHMNDFKSERPFHEKQTLTINLLLSRSRFDEIFDSTLK